MDLLQDLFASSDELQPSLFCGDVQEELPSLGDQGAGTHSVSRTLSLVPTSSAPPPDSLPGCLLRSHSLNEVSHLSAAQTQLQVSRSGSSHCQSVLPSLDYSPPVSSHTESSVHLQPPTNSPVDTYSTVDIAMEMPRYLLQEDETPDEMSEESINASDAHGVSKSVQSSVLASCSGRRLQTVGNASCSGRRLQTVGSECVSDVNSVQGNPSSSHRRHPHKTSVDVSGLPVSLPRPLTMCLPLVNMPKSLHSSQVISLNATPISIATTSSRRQGMCERKKHPYGGGWPKGKSRKVKGEMIPPKPPSTGFGIFLSEKRSCVQEEQGVSSMAVISKVLGQKWSKLSPQEKEHYYNRAERDKQRYTSEMRAYFSHCYKGASIVHLKEVDSLLNDSLTAENDDRLLVCQVCQLSFTSLQNKRSHFGGRLHRQALIKELHHIISVNDDPTADTVTERHIQRSSSDTNKDVTEQLSHTGIQYTANVAQLAEVKQHYITLTERHADLQQQLHELECIEANESKVLESLQLQGNSCESARKSLAETLTHLTKCGVGLVNSSQTS